MHLYIYAYMCKHMSMHTRVYTHTNMHTRTHRHPFLFTFCLKNDKKPPRSWARLTLSLHLKVIWVKTRSGPASVEYSLVKREIYWAGLGCLCRHGKNQLTWDRLGKLENFLASQSCELWNLQICLGGDSLTWKLTESSLPLCEAVSHPQALESRKDPWHRGWSEAGQPTLCLELPVRTACLIDSAPGVRGQDRGASGAMGGCWREAWWNHP